jgi:hypothetical protein
MYVLTPPGTERLPRDRSSCQHGPDVGCSGRRGCVIDEDARGDWNASFQRRLSRIFETTQRATYRESSRRAFVLAIGEEAQLRGAAHAHFIVGVEGADKRAAKGFRLTSSDRRQSHGTNSVTFTASM